MMDDGRMKHRSVLVQTLSRLRRIEQWLLEGEKRQGGGGEESAERRRLRRAVERTAHREEIRGVSEGYLPALKWS